MNLWRWFIENIFPGVKLSLKDWGIMFVQFILMGTFFWVGMIKGCEEGYLIYISLISVGIVFMCVIRQTNK